MARPTNWYSMDYSQQQEWEKNERKHRAELDDAERLARDCEDEANAARRRGEARARQLITERDEYIGENEALDEKLQAARAFIQEVAGGSYSDNREHIEQITDRARSVLREI